MIAMHHFAAALSLIKIIVVLLRDKEPRYAHVNRRRKIYT